MAMKRTTFKRKTTARKMRGVGRRVYKVRGGYRVSPECPRAQAKRRAVIKRRRKTARPRRQYRMGRQRYARRRRYREEVPF